MSDFEQDATWSEKTLSQIVWPAIKSSVGGNLISVEGDGGNIAKQIDMNSGIDAFIKYDIGIKSIASRVQKCRASRPWDSFTIRASRNTGAKTEWEKRSSAVMSNDVLYPMITMQSYVCDQTSRFVSACIIKTEYLYKYAEAEIDKLELRRASNATFYVVYWSRLSSWLILNNIRGSMYVFRNQMAFNELQN